MARLTGYDEENKDIFIKEEERLLSSKGFITKDEMYKITQHLAEKLFEYEQLEDDGLLVKLPFKIGDVVWDNDFGFLQSYVITGFSFGNLGNNEDDNGLESSDEILVYFRENFGTTGRFPLSELGKTVFLTSEEAMKSIKGD